MLFGGFWRSTLFATGFTRRQPTTSRNYSPTGCGMHIFSIVTSGFYGVVNWSVSLCNWHLNLKLLEVCSYLLHTHKSLILAISIFPKLKNQSKPQIKCFAVVTSKLQRIQIVTVSILADLKQVIKVNCILKNKQLKRNTAFSKRNKFDQQSRHGVFFLFFPSSLSLLMFKFFGRILIFFFKLPTGFFLQRFCYYTILTE